MQKKLLFLLAAVVLAAGSLATVMYVRAPTTEEATTPVAVEKKDDVGSNDLDEQSDVVQEIKEAPHPVSLPAFMQKQLDGRELTQGAVLSANESYTRYYITYKSGTLTISGIMNVPKGDGPFPVLILNHGYIDPAVYTNGRGLRREQDYLARRGYVVIHPDYRNHANSTKDPDADINFRLGYAEDAANAIVAVKNSDLTYLDKERIGMLGHSMGGGVSLNVMVAKPELAKAVVLFAPVSGDNRDNFERWTTTRPETAQEILKRYGSPAESPLFWDNISSINFLDKSTAPVMIHHGTADADVPIEWSKELDEALKKEGKSVSFYIYDGQPHEFTSAWTQVMERTTAFFDKQVKKSLN